MSEMVLDLLMILASVGGYVSSYVDGWLVVNFSGYTGGSVGNFVGRYASGFLTVFLLNIFVDVPFH